MEKDAILKTLRDGRAALAEALDGVDAAAEQWRPADGGWTIAECAEHVAVSEQYFLTRLRVAKAAGQSLENRAREAKILARGTDRTRPVACPEGGLPRRRYASAQQALAAFDAARAETEAFVEAFEGDPRGWATDHPVIPGPVNVVEILLSMALHPARHARQIAEVRAEMAPR